MKVGIYVAFETDTPAQDIAAQVAISLERLASLRSETPRVLAEVRVGDDISYYDANNRKLVKVIDKMDRNDWYGR